MRALQHRNMDAPLEPLKSCAGGYPFGPVILRSSAPLEDEAGTDAGEGARPGLFANAPVFSAAEPPTCYDCSFACLIGHEGLDAAIAVLRESGRPGAALRDAVRSGRLEEYVAEYRYPDAEDEQEEEIGRIK